MLRSITHISLLLILPLAVFSQKTFQKRTYYDAEETKLKEVITLSKKDSSLNGAYNLLYENGSLAISGYYTHDQSDSLWIYYYENGREKSRGSFKDGEQNGKWKFYYENGEPKATGLYQGSIRHGSWTYYFENGEEKSSGIYYQNQKEGIWNYFYEDGSLRAQAFFQQGKGHYQEFYASGKLKTEGRNEYDKSEGEWTSYYETNELESRGPFVNGLREGQWIYYHQNGQIAAIGNYSKGEKTGAWKYYFPDGKISSEGIMSDDSKDGFWKLYYNSGEIKGEGVYTKGSGDYVEYYPSGKQKSRGSMQNSMRQGKWEYYNEEGQLDGEAVFVDDIGAYKGYYPDGSLKMSGEIREGKRVGEWTLYNPDGSVAGIYKPVYEDERPIFRTTNINEYEIKRTLEKPEYRYKSKTIRYFTPRINEYAGFIMATNPIAPFYSQLPISLEYYMQERLGYELEMIMHKKPFYRSVSSQINQINTLGVDIPLRQKFYHEDTEMGMFYFGHEIMTGYHQHQASVIDSITQSMDFNKRIAASETRLAYGLFVGDRWIQHTTDAGFTLDFNVGIAVGGRFFKKNFDPSYYSIFNELNQDKFYLPIIITLNIGFAGPKRRNSNY